jgi:hypothetical protein
MFSETNVNDCRFNRRDAGRHGPLANQQTDLLTSMPALLISNCGMPIGMGHLLTSKRIC